MEGTIKVEFYNDDISEALKEVINETAGQIITDLIKENARELVKQKITEIIDPLVMSTLTGKVFEIHRNDGYYNTPQVMEKIVERAVKEYLDQPGFIYSNNAKQPSMLIQSSSGRDKSRLQLLIEIFIARYFDETIEKRLKPLFDEYVAQKIQIEEIAKTELQKLLAAKIK